MKYKIASRTARNVVAVVMTVCLSVALFPASAFAALSAASAGGTVDCGNGWVLSYSTVDDGVTITGYASAPSSAAALAVPETADGATVVGVADAAFRNCDKISELTLPSGVKEVGKNAFRLDENLKAVHVESVNPFFYDYAFGNNAALETFDFAADSHPEGFGVGVFYSCTGLAEIEVPGLAGDDHQSEWFAASYRINKMCFYGCTGLEKVVFKAGTTSDGTDYYNRDQYDIFTGCDASKLVFITYLKNGSNGGYEATNLTKSFFAVNFYASKADAEADKTRTNFKYQMLVQKGTKAVDISAGNVDGYVYSGTGYTGETHVPAVSSVGASSGYVWGLSDGVLTNSAGGGGTTIRGGVMASVEAFPVDRADMTYCYATSDESTRYQQASGSAAVGGAAAANASNSNFHRLRYDGTVDLSSVVVRTSDGTAVDPGSYTLGYRKYVDRDTKADLASAAQVNAEGTYYVYAIGKGAYASTSTPDLEIHVRAYDCDVVDCTAGSAVENVASALYDVSDKLSGAKFTVIAPASSWQACLIGTAMAGAGDGLAVFADPAGSVDKMFQSIVNTRVNTLMFVGPTSSIGQATIERAKILANDGAGTYNYLSDSDPVALSMSVYKAVRDYGYRAKNPYSWGSTVVIMPYASSLHTATIAQYCYQQKAPVLFLNSDGSLSSALKSALTATDSSGARYIKNVVIAGGTAEVSAATATTIKSVSGITPTRMLNGKSAYASSAQLADQLVSSAGNNRYKVSVAPADAPTCAIAAAQRAAIEGGVSYSCASTADTKALAALVGGSSKYSYDSLCAVGSFAGVDAAAVSRFTRVWTKSPLSTAYQAGDTVESGGVLYKAKSSSAVTISKVLDASILEFDCTSITGVGKTFKLASVPASQFKGNKRIATVKLGSSTTSVGANAFAGCTALASVSAPGVTSVGSSAFSGCTKLATATFAKVKTIGTSAFSKCKALKAFTAPKAMSIGSSAFSGCTKLASASFTSTSLKKIASKAFYGCKKLKTLKLKTKKLTAKNVGSNAFKGMPSSAVVKVPKAKAGAYATLFKKVGLAKKAKVVGW